MLKYLVIMLSDDVPSFCHYSAGDNARTTLSIDSLKEAVVLSMKHNLSIQLLLPDNELPSGYLECCSRLSPVLISSPNSFYSYIAHVICFDSVNVYNNFMLRPDVIASLSISIKDLSSLFDIDERQLRNTSRLNIILKDVPLFKDEDIEVYSRALKSLSDKIETIYSAGGDVQVNILSDRLFLSEMNNCNAGVESITMGPDGKYYLCPAFYYDHNNCGVNYLPDGISIPNQHLLNLRYAPICRKCDAYHCKRCVWLNQELTGELNTPSHQQCVISHIERQQSKKLLDRIREFDSEFLKETVIDDIAYLDPFELISR